jgi:hypothetical protein
VIAGVAGALGVVAAETLAGATPAQAAQGSPVLEGRDNTGATSRTGVFTTGNTEFGILADPNTSGKGSLGVYGHGGDAGVFGAGSGFGIGVFGAGGASGGVGMEGQGGGGSGSGVVGAGSGGGSGMVATGGASNGFGVVANGGGAGTGVVANGGTGGGSGLVGTGGGSDGIGVSGIGRGPGDGVHGRATGAAGVGVRAENTAGGAALQATGPAVFSRSGLLTVAAGSSSATRTGVALTAASLVLATLQQDRAGVWVRSAVPNVAGNSFTIHLSKAAAASTTVAWFVVN